MSFSPLIQQLVQALTVLPGVGPKSAQRMAFYLLERDRQGGLNLAQQLQEAMASVKHCQHCRIFCEQEICPFCLDRSRDESALCIVESPVDVLAIEQTGLYRGKYFVLLGHLSPIDGIGPKELGIDLLVQRLADSQTKEIILATNPTVEGEATAHYIAEHANKHKVAVTRIAHGVPLGGELEYVDGGTLAHAFQGRRPLAS